MPDDRMKLNGHKHPAHDACCPLFTQPADQRGRCYAADTHIICVIQRQSELLNLACGPAVSVCVQAQAYRYGYSVSAKLPASYGNALSKFDMQAGTSKQWHEAGCIPVEPLMVPAPDAKSEDDGVVLSVVMGADGKSFLLCLDAGSFQELGRAHLPYGIPYGFHASFIPARS